MRVALLCAMAFVAVTCVAATRPAPQGLEPTLAHKPVHPRLPADANAGAGLEIQNRDWTRSVYRGVERVVDDATPSQVRLAFIPAGISVSWSMAAAQSPMQAVSYGLNPSSLTNNVYATEESTYGSLFFYTALLPNLSPATRYYYQIEGAPAVGSFVTGRAAGDPTQFTTLVVGDMGLDNSPNTIAQMKANMDSTDFYLHIGDLSYADDYYLRWNNTYEGSWDAWQDEMEPMTSAVPYMSLPGNHEVTCTEVTPFLCPTFQRNFTAYRNRFRMPWRESGGVDNLWYSYDYGLAHFIQIDTETDYPNSKMGPGTFYGAGPFGDQVSWFEADLQKAALAKEKGTIAWIVVSGHRPWYSSAGKCDSCQAAFEALMLQYGVDVYFSGHVHWYERMWPLAAGGVITQQNYNSPKGIVYIVNGAAGNVEGLTGSTTPLPYSATIDDTDFGFGKLTVFNSSAMGWQYFKATDGSLVDQILITK